MTMTPLALLMQRDVAQISPKATLQEAAQCMRNKRIGSLLVGEAEEKVGIITESDLVRKCLAENMDAATTLVETVMSSPVISIDIDQTAIEANKLMAEKVVRHLPVTDLGKIIGIVSVRDLLICFKNRI